jgi:hypothetical protein
MDIKKTFTELSVLFPILTLYTVVYLGLMIYDFAARDAFDLPSGMMIVYIALTGAYAADKEIRRWAGNAPESKWGSIFVYAWFIFFLAAYVIRSFKTEYVLPADLSSVALQVLGIFFGSKTSKKIYEVKSGKNPEVVLGRQESVLAFIKQNGKATRKEVMALLKVSRNTAWLLLEDMEKQRLIKQAGEMRGAHYVLPEGK